METVHFMQNHHRKPMSENMRTPRPKHHSAKKRMDFGTWSYIHRAGLSMTVIAFLVFAIAFVTLKITMTSFSMATVIELEFDPVAIEQMMEQIEEQQRRSSDYSNIANRISNDGGQENTQRRVRGGGGGGGYEAGGYNAATSDDGASEIYKMAGKVGGQMGANRAAYEAGLRQVNSMSNSRSGSSGGSDETSQRGKVSGSVAVSYEFLDPVRNDDNLIVPAFMCEHGGTVVVDATLDRNGYVTTAVVDKTRSSADDCLRSTAVKAALGSRFNLDISAPLKHKGTITYEFRPQ